MGRCGASPGGLFVFALCVHRVQQGKGLIPGLGWIGSHAFAFFPTTRGFNMGLEPGMGRGHFLFSFRLRSEKTTNQGLSQGACRENENGA